VQRLRLLNAQRHLVPFAVMLHVEVEVLAFGENRFGVGGPVEFACALGVALEFELEGVGAGGLRGGDARRRGQGRRRCIGGLVAGLRR
jgi:hypothetical protein